MYISKKKNQHHLLQNQEKYLLLQPGKSYTVSSLRIPQGLTAARVAWL